MVDDVLSTGCCVMPGDYRVLCGRMWGKGGDSSTSPPLFPNLSSLGTLCMVLIYEVPPGLVGRNKTLHASGLWPLLYYQASVRGVRLYWGVLWALMSLAQFVC